jgi:hypothetical protein
MNSLSHFLFYASRKVPDAQIEEGDRKSGAGSMGSARVPSKLNSADPLVFAVCGVSAGGAAALPYIVVFSTTMLSTGSFADAGSFKTVP